MREPCLHLGLQLIQYFLRKDECLLGESLIFAPQSWVWITQQHQMSIVVLQPHNQTLQQELTSMLEGCVLRRRKAEQPSQVASSTWCVSSKVQLHLVFVLGSE